LPRIHYKSRSTKALFNVKVETRQQEISRRRKELLCSFSYPNVKVVQRSISWEIIKFEGVLNNSLLLLSFASPLHLNDGHVFQRKHLQILKHRGTFTTKWNDIIHVPLAGFWFVIISCSCRLKAILIQARAWFLTIWLLTRIINQTLMAAVVIFRIIFIDLQLRKCKTRLHENFKDTMI
jgi:hypothetical protein